jgi:hypothetical protein
VQVQGTGRGDATAKPAAAKPAAAKPAEPLERALTVDLTRARVGVLDDGHALGWGTDTRLVLDGFEYQHIEGYRQRIDVETLKPDWLEPHVSVDEMYDKKKVEIPQARRDWLSQQFEEGKVDGGTYRPQPYEQLAHVLAAQGAVDDAQEVLRIKAEIEGGIKRPPWNWLYRWAFGVPFGYGFSVKRALTTFALFVATGTGMTMLSQHLKLLVIDTQPVANVVLMKPAKDDAGKDKPGQFVFDSTATDTRRPADAAGTAPKVMKDLPCLDEITPWVFALDLAVPLLDLHEETRCTIRSAGDDDKWFASVPGFLSHPSLWRTGKGLYAILGWIISSLTILTIAGVFKRLAERK